MEINSCYRRFWSSRFHRAATSHNLIVCVSICGVAQATVPISVWFWWDGRYKGESVVQPGESVRSAEDATAAATAAATATATATTTTQRSATHDR